MKKIMILIIVMITSCGNLFSEYSYTLDQTTQDQCKCSRQADDFVQCKCTGVRSNVYVQLSKNNSVLHYTGYKLIVK